MRVVLQNRSQLHSPTVDLCLLLRHFQSTAAFAETHRSLERSPLHPELLRPSASRQHTVLLGLTVNLVFPKDTDETECNDSFGLPGCTVGIGMPVLASCWTPNAVTQCVQYMPIGNKPDQRSDKLMDSPGPGCICSLLRISTSNFRVE